MVERSKRTRKAVDEHGQCLHTYMKRGPKRQVGLSHEQAMKCAHCGWLSWIPIYKPEYIAPRVRESYERRSSK